MLNQRFMAYRLIEVNDKTTRRAFCDVMRVLYKGDPNFICPLDDMIDGIFDPARNNYFTHGEAIRWIMKSEKGELVGRVAAFINTKKAFTFSQPTGGMGFFECINNKDAAFKLFDTCKAWLQERGMEAMDGPINFGENDNFWGLLVDGFMPQSFGMNYNPPYYRQFFEDYGFKPYFEQVTNHLDYTKPFPERFWKIAERVSRNPEYNFRHFSWKKSDKFIADFIEVYNDAWQFHENFTPIDASILKAELTQVKSLMVPEFIWFAYHQDEPIAFEVMFPDLNQVIKYFNGRPNLWTKLLVALKGKTKLCNRTRITVMGVKVHYQRFGIESGLFWHMESVMKNLHHQYKEVELSWVGDFNPRMQMIHEATGAKFGKKHVTYRLLFNPDASYEKRSAMKYGTREKS